MNNSKYFTVEFEMSGFVMKGTIVATTLQVAKKYASEYFKNVINVYEQNSPSK